MNNQLKPESKLRYLKLVYFGNIDKPYQVAGARAYCDFCRTIKLKDKSESAKQRRQEIRKGFIRKIEKELKSCRNLIHNQTEFDEWHKMMCRNIINRFKSQAELSYGQAQKWLNMTLKYLLLLDDNELRALVPYMHMPIDNVVLKKLRDQFKIEQPTIPWSQWCELDYCGYQKKIRNVIHDSVCPIVWEFENWEPMSTLKKNYKEMNNNKKLHAFSKRVLVLVLVCVVMIVTACSPTRRGERLGTKYCNELSGYEDFETMSEFNSLKNSAEARVHSEYDKYIQKYADDSIKLNEFIRAFNNEIATKGADFITAYDIRLRTIFNSHAWYRENDPNKYFLYSFADDSLNVLNCKEKVAFSLHFDTIYFSDTNHTVAIVDFAGDTILTLKNAYDANNSSSYRVATFEDLILGTWTYRPMENYYGVWKSSWVNFKENGHYNGQEWQLDYWGDRYMYTTISGTYKFEQIDDTTYRLILDKGKEGVDGKIVMSSVDKYRHYYSSGNYEIHNRSKKGALKELPFLFEEKKTE